MDIVTILIVDSLLTTCSIRETARQESRAPSTVSAALDRMESALAVPLMRRDNASLSLTLEAQKRGGIIAETAALARQFLALGSGISNKSSITFAALVRFSSAAYTGSIRAAAKNLGIGQPQLTRQLSELERNLGCELLTRTRTGVTCTDKGKEALALAEEIIRNWDVLTHASADRFRRSQATWHVASVMPLGHESSIAQMLANLTVGWEQRYARQPLFISAGTADELISGLKSRRYDAILIDHADYPKEFDGHILSAAPLALVGDHQVMADIGDDIAGFIASHRIALPSSKSGIRQHAMQYLETIMGSLEPAKLKLTEMDSIPVIINLVSRHGYLSILPKPVVARLPFPITQIELGKDYQQVLTFVWRRNAIPETMIKEIITMLSPDV